MGKEAVGVKRSVRSLAGVGGEGVGYSSMLCCMTLSYMGNWRRVNGS